MIILSFIILNCYIIVLFFLYKGFQRLLIIPSSEILNIQDSSISFTIVIPFRNEARHLPKLVASLNALKFPKNNFEIIFVNDESTDVSINIISKTIDPSISYRILDNVLLTNSPKKDAITLAISKAKGNWIVTTDADCEVPNLWLHEYLKAIETFDAKMLCAPVMNAIEGNFIARFQQAEILSLQGVTMGSFGVGNPLLCNGANLAFEKEAFYSVNGYEGNSHLASGDDIFMLQKMKVTFPEKIYFIKSAAAIVITQPVSNWNVLIKQRTRWASKTTKVKNTRATLLGLLVFSINLLFIVFVLLGLFGITKWYVAALFIFIKISADLLFINKIKRWFKILDSIFSFVIVGFLYPFITCFVAFKCLTNNYEWKGRTY